MVAILLVAMLFFGFAGGWFACAIFSSGARGEIWHEAYEQGKEDARRGRGQ